MPTGMITLPQVVPISRYPYSIFLPKIDEGLEAGIEGLHFLVRNFDACCLQQGRHGGGLLGDPKGLVPFPKPGAVTALFDGSEGVLAVHFLFFPGISKKKVEHVNNVIKSITYCDLKGEQCTPLKPP